MIFPNPLKKGMTIGVASPSFGCTIEPYISRFNEALKKFAEYGYKVKVGDCCHKSDGIGISTNPKDAAAELTEFYCDPEIDAVISCGGGELMCETISYVDFERIKSAPAKWFMGYSDNTNFIYPLVTKCGVAAIYGNNFPGFGKPWEGPETDAWKLLEGNDFTVHGYEKFQSPETELSDPLSKYILNEEKILKVWKNGSFTKEKIEFSGTLIGGCLDVLAGLAGTRFDGIKDFNKENPKTIWILEACDLSPMDIRRSIWRLDECGFFANAAGFLIGRPLAAWKQEMMGVNQYNAVSDLLEKYHVPIVFDADLGHIDPVMPLVMGAGARVTVCGNDITVKMDLNNR